MKEALALATSMERFEAVLDKGYPEFNPDQPRDARGRWSGGSAGGSSDRDRRLRAFTTASWMPKTKDKLVRSYARRIARVVLDSPDGIRGLFDEMLADKRMTIKRLEVLLQRKRSYLENSRVKMVGTLRSRANSDAFNLARGRAVERSPP